MPRLTIDLTDEEMVGLQLNAGEELRAAKGQATWLLRRAIEQATAIRAIRLHANEVASGDPGPALAELFSGPV